MVADPLTPEAFAEACDVSRETLARLETYVDLLRRWQKAINLVSRGSLNDVWRRHVWDSAQLMPHIPDPTAPILDIGSGAGFPGLILAILGVENVTLVDSDARKCSFLREVARQTGAPATVLTGRVEAMADEIPPPAVITARAVASLPLLLDTIKLYIRPNTVCFFHKGRQADVEIEAAQKDWRFTVSRIPSQTDASGVILRLEDIARD